MRQLFDWLFGGILGENEDRNMTYWLPPVKTIQQILDELNSRNDGHWREIKGLQSLNQITLDNKGGFEFHPNEGVIVKSFVNENTGEIKTYFSRYLDLPERYINS